MTNKAEDIKQRFAFDQADVRGCYVRLDQTCKAIQATHHYPPGLAELINQFTAAAVLLKDSIKADGSLTIQMQTNSVIGLLMADCFSDGRVRAICEYDQQAIIVQDIDLSKQEGAVLAITITPAEGERYQSFVPIEYANLSQCLEDYFSRSEQLPSKFKFFATGDTVVGLSLHALPVQRIKDTQQSAQAFEHLSVLLDSLTPNEAHHDGAEEMLTKLFHADHCRIFSSQKIQFGCECNAERSFSAIQSLGKDDIQSLIDETIAENNSTVTVDCHFCFQRYQFSVSQLQHLITGH